MFIFVVYLRRGAAFHLHCSSYNAGTSVLFLGPWVVLVQEHDKSNLDLFAARMQLDYGIYMPAAGETFRCRQVYINPQHHGAQLLHTMWRLS